MASEQPLPRTLPHFKDADSRRADDPWQKAYRTCLRYEAQAKSHLDHIRPRVLGYLIREAPYNESRDRLCQEVNSCDGDNAKLQDLANMYMRSFVRVFRSSRRPAASFSQHPSCPSFDSLRDSLKEGLEQASRSRSREQALKRDNYRCIVTGVCSADLPESSMEGSSSQDACFSGCLEVAHILPRSINDHIATNEGKRHEAAEVWAVMQRFGRVSPGELNGDQVNRLENVMTLWNAIHAPFDRLQLWFEPSDHDPYTCFVKTSLPGDGIPGLPNSFTLRTTDPGLPRPSPDYLRLHAACARVAHLSGAAEHVESIFRDLGDEGILVNDRPTTLALHTIDMPTIVSNIAS